MAAVTEAQQQEAERNGTNLLYFPCYHPVKHGTHGNRLFCDCGVKTTDYRTIWERDNEPGQ
jgi:hypothetical protein